MRALPGIVSEMIAEVVGDQVRTALNRLRGRVD